MKAADVTHPQYASFRIYNISDDTRNQIKAHEYRQIVFQAGYENGNFGPIFSGEVLQGSHGRESAVDTFLDILAANGHSANQATINRTLAAGSTPADVTKASAAAMGVPLADHTQPANAYPRGKVLYGMARDHLTTAANSSDATWFHTPDGVVIVDGTGFVPGGPLVLTPSTGLIGWPQQTQDGIRVRCLLNPAVAVATQFRIDNDDLQRAQLSPNTKFVPTFPMPDANGLYRTLYFEHLGDTRGQEWYTDIIGIGINDTADGGISSLYQRGLT